MLDLPYLNVPELQLKAISEGDTVNRMKPAFHFTCMSTATPAL